MGRAKRGVLKETFAEQLEERGHRVTGPRRAVASAVFSHQDHFTVEDILCQLPRVGRATIFRNVKLMVQMSLLCRVILDDSRVHYQVAERRHHHHIICNECGRTGDLLGCDFEDELRAKAEAQGLVMESHRLEVYGRCRECQAA